MIAAESLPSIRQLVLDAQSGSGEAFEELVTRHNGLVFSICMQVTDHFESAEDAAQETFVSAWKHIQDAYPDSFKPWLSRIASNMAKTQMRKARYRYERRLAEDEDWESPEPTPEEAAIHSAQRQDLVWGFQQLCDNQQMTMALRHGSGLKYEEIAEKTQASVGTVKSRLFRSRRQLAVILRPLMQESA